jgi:hypothetical protein
MKTMSINDVRNKGIKALNQSLGPVGAIRFIQELNYGSGDYTKDRHTWLDESSVDDIFKEIKTKKHH